MAEAMSGFAAINGEPDGGPLLPPIALTDEVAALAGAFAVMVALRHRDRTGEGQVVDVNLLESMLQMMSALPSAAAHLGYDQPRLGSGIPYSVPRGTYRVRRRSLGCGVDVGRVGRATRASNSSASATIHASTRSRAAASIARSSTRSSRPGSVGGHRRRCWPRSRPRDAAIAPVYTMRELQADPHVRARAVFVEVDGVVMQGPAARLMRTPAVIRHSGRPLGADQDAAWTAPAPRPRKAIVPRRAR